VRLQELAAAIPGARVQAGGGYAVRRVIEDSRRAGRGDLWVARRGSRSDGHVFAAEAAGRGAAVAVERPLPLPDGTAWVLVADGGVALAEFAAELAGRPARRMLVVGVTGTAGKTTVTHLVAEVLRAGGLEPGLLSTIAHGGPGQVDENRSGLTTMEAPAIQAGLARMLAAGARSAVIECSSHALDQGRVAACDFDVAAVTNVGRDHLDYHGSVEAYLRAKARLIEFCAAGDPKGMTKTAVLNHDDGSYPAMAAVPIARRLTYGLEAGDVRALDVVTGPAGCRFRLAAGGTEEAVELALPGRHNVANALCAAACGLALGLTVEVVATGLRAFNGLHGRLERVECGQPFDVYIDFAHSAASLAVVLPELRRNLRGRLLLVFGASARADHDPAGMGRAAAEHADFFVVTTDDPLGVPPQELAQQVEAGATGRRRGSDYEVILDREEAIARAMAMARPGDVVLLAGKGHERFLLLADGSHQWDERAAAEAALARLGYG
jgi:UDP-N-acetylmuramoyl-L-alanyl-D-glutamate--2,6-diaminopimelate ligase